MGCKQPVVPASWILSHFRRYQDCLSVQIILRDEDDSEDLEHSASKNKINQPTTQLKGL